MSVKQKISIGIFQDRQFSNYVFFYKQLSNLLNYYRQLRIRIFNEQLEEDHDHNAQITLKICDHLYFYNYSGSELCHFIERFVKDYLDIEQCTKYAHDHDLFVDYQYKIHVYQLKVNTEKTLYLVGLKKLTKKLFVMCDLCILFTQQQTEHMRTLYQRQCNRLGQRFHKEFIIYYCPKEKEEKEREKEEKEKHRLK